MPSNYVEIVGQDPRSVPGDDFRTAETMQAELADIIEQLVAGTITPAAANARTKAIGAELAALRAMMRTATAARAYGKQVG